MPSEKPNASTAGRPLMPTLAANRRAKSPFTPRLAANAASPSTPLSQRSAANSAASGRVTPGSKADLSTPVKAFLDGNNVTPRSSSRKSRVSSIISTPNTTSSDAYSGTPDGTPSGTSSSLRRALTADDFRTNENASSIAGQGSSGGLARGRPKSVIGNVEGLQTIRATRKPLAGGHARAESDVGPRGNISNLFHASDAKSQNIVRKAPAFFYANGEEEETSKNAAAPDPPSPPLSTVSSSKFFHADGKPEGFRDTPLVTPIGSAPSEPFQPVNGARQPPSVRAPSPIKNLHLSYRKGASQVIRSTVAQRPSAMSVFPEQPSIAEQCLTSRRSSVGSVGSRKGHTRGASTSSIDSFASQRVHSSPCHTVTTPSNDAPGSSSLYRSPRISHTEPIDSAVVPQPRSPARSQPNPQQLNELAANARHERKVLDLEISNSSLLAINRQLEREVRKQKTELRRFRRLSRAGRLSLSTVRSSLASDATFDGADGAGLGPNGALLAPLLEDDEAGSTADEYEELDSADEASSIASSSLSPAALEERDKRHRAKDEKRLRLDLTKHRELLVDSQRLNQSLKRCLGWTEELIREGRRALDYRVRVSDIGMGGRVLAREDLVANTGDEGEGVGKEGGGDGGGRGPLRGWRRPDRSTILSEETDKDSGIEVENLGAHNTGLGAAGGLIEGV